ncbi:oligosaccharide flippase family protein [Spirosoma radiotolerans]|uniref:Polysaccharide biosynthesis protein n=1 Tax=Spirosoma radiotolerans TaxID=1379870 RepID=A0A0E3V6U7_9BACT|nr:oligosaccharide flippase family protein [Spirosoma radiotolerans]AKD55337.1 hypothetical protein SD10_10945 [Spirosoma radiotolerans]
MKSLQQAKTYVKAFAASSVIKNFCLTGFFQLVNLSVPVVVTPYLIKTVGLNNFGEIAYVFGFMSVFTVLTEYGFNLTATRQISIHRNNPKKMSAIYTNTLLAKLTLFSFGIIILLAGYFLIAWYNKGYTINVRLYALSTVYVLAQALLPFWVFQGMEILFIASSVNALSKLAYVFSILYLVNEKQDYIAVNFLLGLSVLLSALVLIIILRKKYTVKFVRTSWRHILYSLRDSWDIFVANISVNLYFGGVTILLVGFFTDSVTVGYYGIVEKVIVISKQPIAIFTQVVYPKACSLLTKGFDEIEHFVWTLAKPFVGLNAVLSLIIFSQANRITYYFLKEDNAYVENLIKISAILPFSVSFNLLPYICLLACGYSRVVSKVLILAAGTGVLLNCVLTYYFLATGTVFSVIITEALVATSLSIFLKQKHKTTYDTSAAIV